MLRHVGYSVIQKLNEQNGFYDLLIDLAGQDDDKWYRLCLSVVRRASEYRFLDVSPERNVRSERKSTLGLHLALLGIEKSGERISETTGTMSSAWQQHGDDSFTAERKVKRSTRRDARNEYSISVSLTFRRFESRRRRDKFDR